MAEIGTQLRPIRFGNFEVDLRAGELRRAGVKLKFGGQPLQVLTILLEHPGEVVTREQLQKQLWPDTFVDVDHNLNTAINKIREVLGDSAESPRFVETLPRRGYRFIAPVEGGVVSSGQLAEKPPPLPPPESKHGSNSPKIWLKVGAGIFALAAVALAAVVAHQWHRPQNLQQHALTAVPFTALPGQATSPAFSPDGSRIAFAWNGDPAHGTKGFDLYVKALGSETLLRLTQHPSDMISPAWSPDGTQVAFHRLAGADTGIYVVPALGGPERKLRSTRLPWRPFSYISNLSIISWSPDGKWIAFADELPEEEAIGTYLLSTETSEIRQIPISPKCEWQGVPAFAHNGEYLAMWCFRNVGEQAGLYSSSVSDGKPKMLAAFRGHPNGLTWSADDKRLIYSFRYWASQEIGEVSVTNGSVKTLALAKAELPTVASGGDKLAFSSSSLSINMWRRDLLHPKSSAIELISSSQGQYFAQYSPDGKRIAFQSSRSGLPGVWISNEDGSNLVQLSNPNHASGSPQWSPDGTKVAFDSNPRDRAEIYVADVAERTPRKLVTSIPNADRPHWSRDGKWIYFRSPEPGSQGIYRCPAAGGDAIALSKDIDAVHPQESFDGKTLYFASRQEKSTLKRLALPAQPGTESEVDGFPPLSHADLWTLTPGGIYFVPAAAPRSLRYFDFATKQIHPIFELDKDFGFGLSVSPDGRWIIYSENGDVKGDIMLVEHFH